MIGLAALALLGGCGTTTSSVAGQPAVTAAPAPAPASPVPVTTPRPQTAPSSSAAGTAAHGGATTVAGARPTVPDATTTPGITAPSSSSSTTSSTTVLPVIRVTFPAMAFHGSAQARVGQLIEVRLAVSYPRVAIDDQAVVAIDPSDPSCLVPHCQPFLAAAPGRTAVRFAPVCAGAAALCALGPVLDLTVTA